MKSMSTVLSIAAIVILAVIGIMYLRTQGEHFFTAKPKRPVEKIYIPVATKEGTIMIVGNYWKGRENKAMLLLHMLPSTKESWNSLGDTLNMNGYHVLAIDLRGHGESTELRTETNTTAIDYRDFSDLQHQASIDDVESARAWLINKGIPKNNLYVGGASIGANLTLELLSRHPEIKYGFALSPGLDYFGINTESYTEQLSEHQNALLIAANDDPYSAQTVRTLHAEHPGNTTMRLYLSGGHGTRLFATHEQLDKELLSFFSQTGSFGEEKKRPDSFYEQY